MVNCRNGAGAAKSPQLASSPLNDEFLDKSSRQEEKQKMFARDQQGPVLAHTLSSAPESSKNEVSSPVKHQEQIGMMPISQTSDPRDQQAQVQSHRDSKILSDTTEPERMIEDSADGSAINYQRKPSISEQEAIPTIAPTAVPKIGGSSTIIPSSSTFSSLPPPPLPPASAPPAPTSDLNPDSDQQTPQQMTTRANRAASVSSKSGTPAQPAASDIVPPPRARNTRNNGQRPANSSRNSSASTYNDTATEKYNEHTKGSGASAAGSNQSRRSHKKGVGGNGGTSSGRTSRRGSASSHQYHNLPSTELLSGINTRPTAGQPTMQGIDAVSDHGSRRNSAAGHIVLHQDNSSNSNHKSSGDLDSVKHRRDMDDAGDNGRRVADGSVVRLAGKDNNNANANADVDDDEEEEDDADEPRYCYCNQVSYGEMVACDNPHCLREWFHLACVGLSRPPSSKCKFSFFFLFFFFFSFWRFRFQLHIRERKEERDVSEFFSHLVQSNQAD